MNEDKSIVVYTALHKGGVVFTLAPHDGVTLPRPHMVIGGSRVGTADQAVRWLVSEARWAPVRTYEDFLYELGVQNGTEGLKRLYDEGEESIVVAFNQSGLTDAASDKLLNKPDRSVKIRQLTVDTLGWVRILWE